MPYFISQGMTLYYEEHGSGAPLVLLAGLACHHQTWSHLLEPLITHFRVILLDNRGVGKSTQQCDAYTIDTMAHDVRALLDHLALDKAHIVGHSMGGMIAQAFAHHHPTAVDRLVIAASTTRLPPHAVLQLDTSVDLLRSPLSLALLIRNTLPWLYADSFLTDTARVTQEIQVITQDLNPQSTAAYAGQVAALTAFDYTAVTSPSTPPTLLLTGAQDLLIPEQLAAKQLSQRYPGAVWHSLPDCGHMPHREQPAKFASLLQAFLGI